MYFGNQIWKFMYWYFGKFFGYFPDILHFFLSNQNWTLAKKFKNHVRIVYHKQFYIHPPIFRNPQTFRNSKSFHIRSGLYQSLEFAVFYVITNQGLLQPAPGMESFWVSKCLPVPENEMNIDLDVVKYSDFDFKISVR